MTIDTERLKPDTFDDIAAVLFDLDETLLDRTTSLVAFLANQYARFADRLGDTSFEAWRESFLALDARGHVRKSVVYPAILAEFGGDPAIADVLLDDYQMCCCRHAREFPGAEATLRALRARGLRLAIVSNGETEFQMLHIDALGLKERVDAVLVSQAEGLRKPDIALFQRAARRLRVEPGRCLFVGDNPAADIVGAYESGMRTVWFRRGASWPDELVAMPDAAIDRLPQLLGLVTGKT
jgi:putative hydrolase of the HAD superfamily